MVIDINIVAVLVAAAANFVIGFAWYSPLLFEKTWMKEMGITKEEQEKAKKKGMAKEIVTGFVIAFVLAYVLAHFIGLGEMAAAGSAFILALWIWLGFFAAPMFDSVLWEKRSVTLWAISSGYRLAGLLAMTAIISLWP